MKLVAACAVTEDDQVTEDKNFSEAHHYRIYEINGGTAEFDKDVPNTAAKRASHGMAPANDIMDMMRPEGVQVLVAGAYGPNLPTVQAMFAVVLVPSGDPAKALELVAEHADEVEKAWNVGAWREVIDLRNA
jgi:predicted Fe-Mo cluster-binding NifX family protein